MYVPYRTVPYRTARRRERWFTPTSNDATMSKLQMHCYVTKGLVRETSLFCHEIHAAELTAKRLISLEKATILFQVTCSFRMTIRGVQSAETGSVVLSLKGLRRSLYPHLYHNFHCVSTCLETSQTHDDYLWVTEADYVYWNYKNPRLFRLTPSSGTLTQYASSDLKHDAIASIALIMAKSIPLSLI